MNIKTLIVDDELLARRRISQQLEPLTDFSVIGQCSNGEEAIKSINQSKPDLIFLDIKLKDMTGFQVLKNVQLANTTKIIFVTAYDNYAINAFDVFAYDFILKPIENDRFKSALDRILTHFALSQMSNIVDMNSNNDMLDKVTEFDGKKYFEKLPYAVGNKIRFIPFIDIKYILASGSYCEVYMNSDKKIVLRNSLNKIINLLDKNKFYRVHRSTIINLDHLDEIICSSYQETDVKMLDNKTFRVSKSKRKEIMTTLRVQ